MMPLAFVDTETTGLHQDKQLYEVAIIRREYRDSPITREMPYWHETRYSAFVPVDLSNADLFGLNVGHFYERHPLGRELSSLTEPPDSYQMKHPREIAVQVARFTHGARFIGAAPSFDAAVLGDFLRRHGLLPTWHHRLVDTHDLAIGYLLGQHLLTPGEADVYAEKKDVLSRMLGVEPHNDPKLAHTAMGDAQHEADIWDAIMGAGR